MNEQERNRLNEITARLHDALARLEEWEKKRDAEIDELKDENKWLRDELGRELGAW
jgi:uncharacterized protein YdcH (DUF465 family)